jgi:hypothetical protein
MSSIVRYYYVHEGKVYPFYALKAYRGNISMAPLILNLGTVFSG